MGKKQVIMSLDSAADATKKVFLILQVDADEYETKISKMKNGEKDDGATMSEYSIFKAQKSKSGSSSYEPYGDDDVLQQFGTTSGDGIVEFYYKNILNGQA